MTATDKKSARVNEIVRTLSGTVALGLKRLLRDARLLYTRPLHWRTKEWSLFMIIILAISFIYFIDNEVRTDIAGWHNGLLDAIFGFGHWYGGGKPTMYILLAMYGLGLIAGAVRLRNTGALIAESYILAGMLTISIKSLFGRWRPYTGHGSFNFVPFTTGPNDHLSFPSGHVTVAFALSSVMAGMFDNWIWKASWYGAAAITAFSRVYHDQHWLSDDMLSAIIGTSVGIWLLHHTATLARDGLQTKKETIGLKSLK